MLLSNLNEKIVFFFTKGHERSINAKKNILGSFLIKGLSILTGFLLVPLALDYLDSMRYGIWLTLSSILVWFGFFDIGLGNGLRNKFAEALAKNRKKLAHTYVSTTYFILSIIIVTIFIIFFIINPFLDWTKILNTPAELKTDLSALALVVFGFFCLNFVLKLISSILLADQRPAIRDIIFFIGKLLNLIIIFILVKTTKGSLFKLGLVYSLTPVFALLIANIYFFCKDYKEYIPSLKYVDFSYAKDLMSLGFRFFIIQITAVILFTTDNMIITQLFDPSQVTPYNIAHKYFGMVLMAFIIIITPFWSAFTEAYTKKDFLWIKRIVKKLIKLWSIVVLLVLFMLLISNKFYLFWIGSKVNIPFTLSVFMGLFVVIQCWCGIFVHFINGIGKIKLQQRLSVFIAVLNIPISVFLAKYLNMGPKGVILATVICLSLAVIIAPIQYYKLINGTAKGIWDK